MATYPRPWRSTVLGDDQALVQRQRERLQLAARSAPGDETTDETQAQLVRLQARLDAQEGYRTDRAGPAGLVDELQTGLGVRPVVRAQLIVQTSQVVPVLEAIQDPGDPDPVMNHDERIGLSLLTFPDMPAPQLRAAILELRQRGHVVGPNDVVMQSWTVKGLGSPLPTTRELGSRPEHDSSGAGVVVGVIDGGFAPDISRRTDGWLDGVIGPYDPETSLDCDDKPGLDSGAGHGTFVSGVLRQVAPACTVRQYRAVNTMGFGSTWGLKDAILKAGADGCQVINLSVGFDDKDHLGSPAISAALYALPPEVLIVAAAGNNGSPIPVLPAGHPRVLAVGALDPTLEPTPWTSRGHWVELSCVGEGIVSTYVEGTAAQRATEEPAQFTGANPVCVWSGSSFAAPQISGLLAELLSRGRTPAQAVDDVRHRARAARGPAHPDVGYRLRVL